MTATILRRPRLGRTSVRELSRFMESDNNIVRSDWIDKRKGHNRLHDTDLVIRWGCTANIPINGDRVLNTAASIHEVNNKSEFRKKLNDASLCPPTFWEESLPVDARFFPLVVRPRVHSRGRRLYVVHNHEELMAAAHRCGDGWYASTLINKEAEYRVFVVQGRAVAVARKTPGNPDDVAWNVARGGRFDNVRWDEWPLRAVRVAIEGYGLSSLDFGGVDVMDDGERSYVIEINSAPSLTSPYRQECMAKAFDYIVANGKDRIPLIEGRGGYRKFIHPAINENAQLV